ncbi:hypothetical protein [Patulibacter minatonensis]|uniref:hypothetical protein n=1 Tax=Patulibacter minatonensis TaxID=298163 RepID=UPI00047A7DB5|nr:hypothetical protein [Patulibacter minatonensis]
MSVHDAWGRAESSRDLAAACLDVHAEHGGETEVLARGLIHALLGIDARLQHLALVLGTEASRIADNTERVA